MATIDPKVSTGLTIERDDSYGFITLNVRVMQRREGDAFPVNANGEWRWLSIPQGRDRFRQEIEKAEAAKAAVKAA